MESGQDKEAIRTGTTVSLDNSQLLTFLDENDTKVRILISRLRRLIGSGG